MFQDGSDLHGQRRISLTFVGEHNHETSEQTIPFGEEVDHEKVNQIFLMAWRGIEPERDLKSIGSPECISFTTEEGYQSTLAGAKKFIASFMEEQESFNDFATKWTEENKEDLLMFRRFSPKTSKEASCDSLLVFLKESGKHLTFFSWTGFMNARNPIFQCFCCK